MNAETMMINERLNQIITSIIRLNELERRKKNQELQKKNDAKYCDLVHQSTELCKAIHYAQNTFSFPYQPQLDLLAIINDLEIAAKKNAVNEDHLLQCARMLKPIQEQIKKEWGQFYPTLAGAICNTLRIIQKIDPPEINKLLHDIQEAAEWQNNDLDLVRLGKLSEALMESKSFIARLALDQEVTRFLTKVSSGTASLSDLTDRILEWIKKENLTERIKISFN